MRNSRSRVAVGLSVIALAWGLLSMEATFRAFAWLRDRSIERNEAEAGFVRLLLGAASFVVITQGARIIASALGRSQTNAILLSLLAAAVLLALRGILAFRRAIAGTRLPPVSLLGRTLAVQTLLLLVYGVYGLIGAAASPGSPAWIAFGLLGCIWLFVTTLLVIWWRERRTTLVRRALAWACVAWLTVFVVLFMPWERSRRLLVPPRGQVLPP